MSDSELVSQRRANYEELLALGIRPYPNAYDLTHRISDIVATYGEHGGEALEAEHVPVRAAGIRHEEAAVEYIATLPHLKGCTVVSGIEHTRLSYRFQGRDFRLTDVRGHVVKAILA